MKNSSTGSSSFVRADSSSAIVLFSTMGPLERLCPAPMALLPQPSLAPSVQPAEPQVLKGPLGFVCVCGRHSLNSLARLSTAEAPTAAGLSEWKVIKRSMEEERVIVLTDGSERGETGTPVSTLVSGSSSSSSRRRWERERVIEGRRGESG